MSGKDKYPINQMLRNAISQTGPVPRLAGMVFDGMLHCYLHGAEKFTWNPETNAVTMFHPYRLQGDLEVLASLIDPSLCKDLYHSEMERRNRRIKIHPDEVIKKELGITKKSLSKKDREKIDQYKESFL